MGYTIPLDKGLTPDGQGPQEVQINDQMAREAVAMRSKVQREELLLKEKEQELCALAQKARSERTGMEPVPGSPVSADRSMVDDDMRVEQQETRKETREEGEQRMECEKLREERWQERERERRLEARDAATEKKSKITRDMDRDTSEKVSLRLANTGAGRTGEVMYDQRLFIQEKGMDSGHVADGQYNIYDEGLFTAHPTLSTIYRPKTDADTDMYGGADEQLEKKVLKTGRFKPDEEFMGASERPSASKRERPVEFSMNEDCDILSYEAAGEEGFESGEEDFGSGEEDLFSYWYKKDTDMYGGADEQLEKKVLKTDRLKPDEEFTGASERPSGSKSERPVEFITDRDWDIFGYEEVIARSSSKWKKKRLHPMDDDEIDGNGTSILMTDGYNHYLGLYRI